MFCLRVFVPSVGCAYKNTAIRLGAISPITLATHILRLPQPIGKDKYTVIHLLKESIYPSFYALPVNPFHHVVYVYLMQR